VDLFNIAIVVVWQSVRVQNGLDFDSFRTHLANLDVSGAGRFTYVNSASLANTAILEITWVAIIVILYWLKLLKYVVRAPSVGPVVSALMSTMFDHRVMIFTGVFALVLFSFTLGFTIAFGQRVPTQFNLGTTAQYLTFFVFGQFDQDYYAVSQEFGPVLAYMILFLMSLVMLNIFIAVISDVYNDVLRTSQQNWEADLTRRMAKEISGRTVWKKVRMYVLLWHKRSPKKDVEDIAWNTHVLDMYAKRIEVSETSI